MRICPCGSGKTYQECCELLIAGGAKAETAEQLMRSRYTAYADKNVDYILKTTHPETVTELKRDELQEWADSTTWEQLNIVDTATEGQVEFIAYYREKEGTQKHHELALFKKHEGDWFFYDSQFPKQGTVVNTAPKVGRNDPCVCGSGKKYKKCCGAKG